MSAGMDISDSITQTAQHVARTKPWVERLARLGYAIKGLVYLLIGLLAVQAAFGIGGETMGTEGALRALQRQAFGQALLVLTTVGLFGYALWRLIQAWLDPDHDDSNKPKRIAQRVGYVISGLTYGILAWEALRMVMGFASSSGGQDSTEHWTSQTHGPTLWPLARGHCGVHYHRSGSLPGLLRVGC
jgi:hypothetical protein